MNIRDVLKATVQLRASDLFLKVNSPPRVRVDGNVRQLGTVAMTKDDLRDAFAILVDEHSREGFKKNHEVDTAIEEEGIGRFRVNGFMQRGNIGFVLRYVRGDVPDFKDLGLPVETFERLANLRRGRKASPGDAAPYLASAVAAYKRALRTRTDDPDAKWNLELALREQEQNGGGGGGGGGGSQPPPPTPPPSKGQQELDKQRAEAVLNSAARDEREVQTRRQRNGRPRDASAGRDW